MGYSAKITLRKPARTDGSCQVRLQVILNREILFIGLDITWPQTLFDEEAGKCLTKLPATERPATYAQVIQSAAILFGSEWQQRAADNNLIIGKAQAKANEVFIQARLNEQSLTKEDFLREYQTAGSKADFITYMDARIEERFRRQQISPNTHKNHRSTLNKLREFRGRIPFNTLTYKFADDFESWLKQKVKCDTNTRWGRHKHVKTYLALAKRDRIIFDDPYAHFKNKTVPGHWRPLAPGELSLLESYYIICAPGTPHRRIMQKFLFSCNSSLRLGDLKAIGQAKLQDRQVRIQTHKGREQYGRELLLPLTRKALRYLHDSQQENARDGFYDYSDQYENRTLQAIGRQLGIETKIHHHVGRETFATNFIRMGGKVEVLQKLMGHTKLSTTMKYVHVDEAMKQAEIDKLDAIDRLQTSQYESV